MTTLTGASGAAKPGAVILTEDVDATRAKVASTALQARLGEIVVRLVESHGLDGAAARSDHAFLTAETVPHKALLGMRFAPGRGVVDDIYVGVENPLR